MKPKPLKHKEENTFRFETFQERLQKINISSINHFKRRLDSDEQDEELSYFAIAIDKWQELNLSSDYKELRRKIGSHLEFQTLAQVLHRKDELSSILINHLRERKMLSLNANLDLLVALTRDLQSDFYPYFNDSYSILIELTCEVTDTESIENIFVCLTFLFKYLWKNIAEDIEHHFETTKKALLTKKDHIVYFTSEVFSFIIKKSKNPEKLIHLLFECIHENDELSKGIGRILFEIVKGVNKGFISKSSKYFEIIFNKYLSESTLVFDEIMTYFIQYCCEHSSKDSFKPIWKNYLLPKSIEVKEKIKIYKIIPFICQAIEYHGCKLVSEPNEILLISAEYITKYSLHQYLKNILLNSLESIFSACDNDLSIDSIQTFSKLLLDNKLYRSDDTFLSTIFNFLLNISLSTTFFFDIHINRHFTLFISNIFRNGSPVQQDLALQFYATLFQIKRPRPTLGNELHKISKYPLQFENDKELEIVLKFVQNKLKKSTNLQDIIYSMIVLSNVSTSNDDICFLSDIISNKFNPNNQNDQFFGLMLVESVCALNLMQTGSSVKNYGKFIPEILVDLVVENPTNQNYLLALDLYLSTFTNVLSNKTLEEKFFKQLYDNLSLNLESYNRQIRLLSLHLLTLFKYDMPDEGGVVTNDKTNIFQICFDAEMVPIELSQYRERLKHVRKLDCNFVKSYLPKHKFGINFAALPVRYLLGSLYENLTLLWKPTLEIIETYVHYSSDKKTVVETIFEHFKLTNKIIEHSNVDSEDDQSNDPENHDEDDGDHEEMNENLDDNQHNIMIKLKLFPMLKIDYLKSNFDHYNHRLQLLKGFEMFSEVIEKRNREYIEMFFNFLNNEMKSVTVYLSNNRECLRKITDKDEDKNIDDNDELMEIDENNQNNDNHESDNQDKTEGTLKVDKKSENIEDDNEEGEDNDDDDENNEAEIKNEKKTLSKASLWKTYFSFLNILSKFKNPKACYREPELLEMYLNMLVSPNVRIQKSAMNCLYTYNHDYLNKYKDNFNRLLDDKSFSSEIHSFIRRDNPEDNTIHINDRDKVIPTFLRILFGKMLASSGTKKHGKSRIDFLRSIILKTVSSFDESEQKYFLDLIYLSLESLISTEYEDLNKALDDFIDIDCFMSFKQFQTLITTLESILKHFGSKSQSLMHYLFKILIICSGIVSRLLSSNIRCQLKPFIIRCCKTFRINCFKVAIYFFGHFDQFSFKIEEIDQLFTNLIEPLLITLKNDSQESPSPLLKLLHIWSENPRYYCLLVKQCSITNPLTPLEAIIQLYDDNDNISQTTSNYITGMIENLLLYDSTVEYLYSDPSQQVLPLEINNFGNKLPDLNDYPEYKDHKVNFGSIILIPFIKKILNRISKNRQKYDFTIQEINVLARLSFFLKDPNDCSVFSSLLFHSISNVKRPEEEKEVFTLKTLNHLVKNIPEQDFHKLLQQIIPLFYLVDKPLARKELAVFLNSLSMKKPSFKKMSYFIVEINAYDNRYLEEPDYNRRIDAFKKITTFMDTFKLEDQNEFDFIHLLLNNCSFFLNKFEDLSLKELSSNVLIKICEIFKNSEGMLFNRFVINLLFLKIISYGLKHEKESVRHDYLDILWKSLKILHGSDHSLIIQMQRLMCFEDEEIDFWRNMKHIQLHRRARALTRLTNNTELLNSFTSKMFVHFLIPIANSFVMDSTLPTRNMALFGSSIDALAVFLQHCSWYKYENTLMHYFNGLLSGKIDAKISIKVISALLSRFNFLKPEIIKKIEDNLKNDDFQLYTIEYSEISANTKKLQKKSKKEHKIINIENKSSIIQSQNDDNEDESSTTIDKDSDNSYNQQKKIYESLCKNLLPMLHRCLHQRSETDYSNDKHHEIHPEEEEIQRIPLALGIVKLLKHIQLNEKLFQANITSIFLRLCQFIQSRSQKIRESARSTLIQIMKTLGPKYFNQIFNELNSLLTRGYQKHILIFTVYVLLSSLMDQFQKGDLDSSLKGIIDICNQELFGTLADEKEITQITSKTKEAKKLKSYDIYEILGRFVSEKALDNLINPLKGSLMDATRSKVLKKIQEALYKIGRGLVANKWLSESIIMEMICKILDETKPSTETDKDQGKMAPLSEILPKKVDYLLINQKALRRVDQTSKINKKSHMYLLSNFALTCFRFMLKNNRLKNDNTEHCNTMEPTIELLRLFLFSNDVSVITTTLFCFHELLIKFPNLKSFTNITQSIISQMFVLLKKYSGMNSDNSELIALCFKSIAHFVNLREESKLSNDEIAVLISYAESEIEHNSKNATVYYLIGAIIRRKLVSKEMHQMMEKMAELAITTEIDVVRSNSITLSIKYLTEFPIESNRFKGKLTRLIRNLEYKTISGRIAAGTILRSVINILPYSNLSPIKLELFVPISARLVNEDDTELKKLVSDIVRNILTKLTRDDRQELWETFILPWLESDEMLIWTLGSKLCSILLQVEGKEFLNRVGDCLPFISKQLDPKMFKSFTAQKNSLPIEDKNNFDEDDDDDEEEDDEDENDEENDENNNHDNDDAKRKQFKLEDDLIFQHLNFIFKLLKTDNIIKLLLKYNKHFNNIFQHIMTDYILHPHSWIRSLSTQIFGQLFSLFSPEMFTEITPEKQKYFLFSNKSILSELTKKFCLVFRDLYSCSTIQEQLVKNLVYISRIFILLDENVQNNDKKRLTSLISRMIFEVKFEIKNYPNQFEKRIFLFKWIAAISIQLGKESLINYLPKLLPPLCREELSSLNETVGGTSIINSNGNTQYTDDDDQQMVNAIDFEDIKQRKELLMDLNKQVLQIIKKLVGTDVFVEYYNTARSQLSSMRLERKKNRAIQMVTNVSSAVKRKQRKHKRDKALKRKKLS